MTEKQKLEARVAALEYLVTCLLSERFESSPGGASLLLEFRNAVVADLQAKAVDDLDRPALSEAVRSLNCTFDAIESRLSIN
jgi:hypothetical protein